MCSFDSKVMVDMAIQQFETRHNKELQDHEINFAREQVVMIVKESVGRMTAIQFKYRYPDYNNNDAMAYLDKKLTLKLLSI